MNGNDDSNNNVNRKKSSNDYDTLHKLLYELENLAIVTIQIIQKDVIDVIRTIPEFQQQQQQQSAAARINASRTTTASITINDNDNLSNVRLFQILCFREKNDDNDSINKSTLKQQQHGGRSELLSKIDCLNLQIQEAINQLLAISSTTNNNNHRIRLLLSIHKDMIHDNEAKLMHNYNPNDDDDDDCNNSNNNDQNNNRNNNERTNVIQYLLLPLIFNLALCYTILDEYSNTVPSLSATTKSIQQQQQKQPILWKRNNNTTNQKAPPPPPIGMISLQNYTDIGCLMELLVCNCIVPFIDENILLSLQDRIQYTLPKSFLGRILKKSLLWGSASMIQGQQILDNGNEMKLIVTILGHLLLLDRFRPMLLPRHLSDLYAGILQYEHDNNTRTTTTVCSNNDFDDDDRNNNDIQLTTSQHCLEQQRRIEELYQEVAYRLLGRNICILRPAFRINSEKQQQLQRQMVDNILQAKTYQKLLSHGTVTPLWMRQIISKFLTNLACHDLQSLIVVFVIYGTTSNGNTIESFAACQRLANAIIVVPINKSSSTKIHNNNIDTNNKNSQSNNESSTVTECNTSINKTMSINRSSNCCDMTNRTTTDTDSFSTSFQYYCLISDQLLFLLDNILKELTSSSVRLETIHLHLKEQHCATIHTIWAILDLLPDSVIENYFRQEIITNDIQVLIDGDDDRWNDSDNTNMKTTKTTTKQSCIHRVVRRFGILLSSIPGFAFSTNCTDTICRLFLQPLSESSPNNDIQPLITLLGLLIRLASTPTVLKSDVKQDATYLLQLLIETIEKTVFTINNTNATTKKVRIKGEDVIASALVHSLIPNNFEINHCYEFHFNPSKDADSVCAYEMVNLAKSVVVDVDSMIPSLVDKMEQWTKVIIQSICRKDHPKLNSEMNKDQGVLSEKIQSSTVAFLFRIVLILYVSGNVKETLDNSSIEGDLVPFIFRQNELTKLVPLVVLPIVCEEGNLTESLLRSVDDDDGILNIMGLVFSISKNQLLSIDEETLSVDGATNNMQSTALTTTALRKLIDRWNNAAMVFPQSTLSKVQSSMEGDQTSTVDNELIISLMSILLSILITILELGEKDRSRHDESTLQSFIALLGPFASSETIIKCNSDNDFTLSSEVAGMASHAIALLASRKASNNHYSVGGALDETGRSEPASDPVRIKIQQAETDLASIDPPIRARGIVTLRHLCHSLADQKEKTTRPKVWIVEDGVESGNIYERHFRHILNISVQALCDKESYVYLAAIHTIVALCEADTTNMIPLVSLAVCTGKLSSGTDDNETSSSVKELSMEQVVKLAEALIFVIRRRSTLAAIFPKLIDLMIYGSPDTMKQHNGSNSDAASIQKETHKYFIAGYEEHDDEIVDRPMNEKWEDMDLRLRTGGPLFASEENDVVRAERINVVKELVAAFPSYRVAPHCATLIRCVVDTLRLEVSRPVRRAGASLARELYSVVVREQDSFRELSTEDFEIPMAIGMAAGDEEVMYSSLQRCLSGKDLDDIRISKRFDPATVARCQEALALREKADSGGILAAGRLLQENLRKESRNPLLGLLREPTQEQQPRRISNLVIKEL